MNKEFFIADTVQKEQRHPRWDYKKYVGGHWEDAIGQLGFLGEQRLLPKHTFLDIGCGSLRSGRYFIDFLDEDKYFGFDHHRWLIEDGLQNETGMYHWKKNPRFVVDDQFNFALFNKKFDFAWAKSVFTHLTLTRIELCLKNLRPIMAAGGVFYSTFFEGSSLSNRSVDNDIKRFRYSLEEIRSVAEGWKVENLGIINDQTEQTMLKFTII